MPRVLIVSRNPAMAMGLSATDYEVAELRPPAFGAWIEGEAEADALILDLDSPQLSLAAVSNLRDHGKRAPVLLVSSASPGWDDPRLRELTATEVLPLPITRPALLSALETLLAADWAAEAPFLPPEEQEPHPDVFRTAEVLQFLREDEPPAGPDLLEPAEFTQSLDPVVPQLEPYPEPAPVPAARHHDAPVDIRPETARVGPLHGGTDLGAPPEQPALSAVPRTSRSLRTAALPTKAATSQVLDDLDRLRLTTPEPDRALPEPAKRAARPSRRARREAGPDGVTESGAATRRKAGDEPVELVRALARSLDRLYGVPETAEVIITDAVALTKADAGALMVPDGGDWRVAAGVGLRPLEHRYELRAESWLVQEIARGLKGAIVEDSDIARERLQGAPLASWRHLLAAPVPEVQALLILARREDPPFDEHDLAALATVGAEAGPLLAAAIDTRALARRLWEFRDEVDLPR